VQLASSLPAANNVLRTDKFYRSLADLKRPLVWIVDASVAAGTEPAFGIVAPGPQVVAALNQIADHNIIVPAESVTAVTASAMTGRFI